MYNFVHFEILIFVHFKFIIYTLENAYPEIVTQDLPLWTENTELLQWLDNLCK